MNGIESTLPQPLSSKIAELRQDEINTFSDEQKKQTAKDFESVFVSKLLDEMKTTVESWDDQEDGASEQVRGIFDLCLAHHIADNGGFGMWKDIYKFLTGSNRTNTATDLLDKNV